MGSPSVSSAEAGLTDLVAKKAWPRRWWLVVVVLALGAAGAWYSSYRRSAAVAEPVTIGAGRAVLLDFGMGVCEQCKRMRPVMERAARELGDRVDVRVLDIRQEDNERLADRFNMTTIPLIVLVDGSGRERWRHEGFVGFDELMGAVKQRLSASEAPCASGSFAEERP
jgi:thiol-disulfide isomerase/thioredoxin